jgi:hypothetical protein
LLHGIKFGGPLCVFTGKEFLGISNLILRVPPSKNGWETLTIVTIQNMIFCDITLHKPTTYILGEGERSDTWMSFKEKRSD